MSYRTEGEFLSVRGGQGLSKGKQGLGAGWLEAWNKGTGAWGGCPRAWRLGPGESRKAGACRGRVAGVWGGGWSLGPRP